MADPRDFTPDDDVDAPSAQWWGLRGSRQRVRRLVQWMVEQNDQREAERQRHLNERFQRSWDRTNQLFDPPTDMVATHKRLHLPIGRPDPPESIEQVPLDPDEREGVPDDYQPSMEPVPGSESVNEEKEP